jgi:SAM-dependent methyltransferase
MFMLIRQLASRQISIRQALLAISHFLSPRRMLSGDDFNWSSYHLHYRHEISSISKMNNLVLDQDDFSLKGGKLSLLKQNSILPSHHVLYESIANLQASSLLEIGCGGGDHLKNLSTLFPTKLVRGIDLSKEQIAFALERHPDLAGSVSVIDISRDTPPKALHSDLVYSHAVLMHISEKGGRFESALENMFIRANNAVVLVENWQQHDFFSAVKRVCASSEKWSKAQIFVHESSAFPEARAMIIALECSAPLAESYEVFLQGGKLRAH